MTTASVEELRVGLSSNPATSIILTSVEGVADKDKREVLRRSCVTVGHIGWDEAMIMDEVEGWGDFRSGSGTENRRYLAAVLPGIPWILASATE